MCSHFKLGSSFVVTVLFLYGIRACTNDDGTGACEKHEGDFSSLLQTHSIKFPGDDAALEAEPLPNGWLRMLNRGVFGDGDDPAIASIDPHPFWAFNWQEDVVAHQSSVLLCSFILFFTGAMCAMAGIGGNIIQVTVLMAAGGLTPHDAVPLSKVVIVAGSVCSLAVHILWPLRKNQLLDNHDGAKIQISWETCWLAVPASLLGIFIGVLMNSRISDVALISILTLILACLSIWVFWKTNVMRQKELNEPVEDLHMADDVDDENDDDQDEDLMLPTRPEIDRKQCCVLEFQDGILMLGLLLVVLSCSIIRELNERCHGASLAWWSDDPYAHCEHPVLRIIFWGKVKGFMLDKSKRRALQMLCILTPIMTCLVYCEYVAQKVMRSMSKIKTRRVQLVMFSVGMFGSMTGVGGGVVLAPFFVMIGLTPSATIATSATCVALISSASALHYIITNRVKMGLALIYGCVNMMAASSGALFVHRVADTWARPSFIMMIIGLCVALSTLISSVRLWTCMLNTHSKSC